MPVSKGKCMSRQQLELIVSTMEGNNTMAEHRVGRNFIKDDRKEKWEELAAELNAIKGANKTAQKWKKCWSDKKSDLRKKVERIIEDRAKPGGPTSDEKLTRLEERIMCLSGWSKTVREEELFGRDSNSDSMGVEVNEAVDNLVEISAAMNTEIPAAGSSNTATIITLIPTTVQNVSPVTVTSSMLTRKRKRDEDSASSSVEVTPTTSFTQPQEPMARKHYETASTVSITQHQEAMAGKPYETGSLSRIATACEINNCKLQEQTVTLQQIVSGLPRPEEATALKRIAAAYEINNCKMQEQTQTLQRLTATLLTRPDPTTALNRIASACETRANEAVKQTLLLEKILSTLTPSEPADQRKTDLSRLRTSQVDVGTDPVDS